VKAGQKLEASGEAGSRSSEKGSTDLRAQPRQKVSRSNPSPAQHTFNSAEMLASLVNRSPIVRVTLDDSEVFVNPIPLPGHRAVDPVVRGTVLLSLSTARAIKKVKVILEGQCDVFGKLYNGRFIGEGGKGRAGVEADCLSSWLVRRVGLRVRVDGDFARRSRGQTGRGDTRQRGAWVSGVNGNPVVRFLTQPG
jgi:hypothetical protein